MLRRVDIGVTPVLCVCVFLQGCSFKHRTYADVPPAPEGVSEELNEHCHTISVRAGGKALNDLPEGGETITSNGSTSSP